LPGRKSKTTPRLIAKSPLKRVTQKAITHHSFVSMACLPSPPP
jgi:hypothetical protein